MAKAEAPDPEPEPSPNGDPLPDDDEGGGDDAEEQAWQRLAPRLKALHRETLNEWLDEVAASTPTEPEPTKQEKHEPTRRAARPTGLGADGGGAIELPKGGREKAAGKAGGLGSLGRLLFGE